MNYHDSLSRPTRCYTTWRLEVCRDRTHDHELRRSVRLTIQDCRVRAEARRRAEVQEVEYEIQRLHVNGTLRSLFAQEAVRVEQLEGVLRAVLPAYASERTRLWNLSRESTSDYGTLLETSLRNSESSGWGSTRQQAKRWFRSLEAGRGPSGESWVSDSWSEGLTLANDLDRLKSTEQYMREREGR